MEEKRKRYEKYGRKQFKYMENTEESQVEQGNSVKNMEEK